MAYEEVTRRVNETFIGSFIQFDASPCLSCFVTVPPQSSLLILIYLLYSNSRESVDLHLCIPDGS